MEIQMRIFVFSTLFLFLLACGSSRSHYEAAPSPQVVQVYGGPVSHQAIAMTDSQVSGDLAESTAARSSESRPKAERQAPGKVDYDQKLVKNGSMTIETDEDNFPQKIKSLKEAVVKLDGYVSEESRDRITLRVPSGRLDELVAIARQLGKVTRQDIRVQDVTSAFVDLQIRIDNLKRLRARLQELVEAGSNVQEVLEVERELARVTRELEQLEGQLRLMDSQVTFATLVVFFENDISPGPIGWIFYGTYHAIKWLFVWD